MEHQFKLCLQDLVTLSFSGESGEVIGRGHFLDSEDSYLIRYKTADGRLVEAWWPITAISEVA